MVCAVLVWAEQGTPKAHVFAHGKLVTEETVEEARAQIAENADVLSFPSYKDGGLTPDEERALEGRALDLWIFGD